MSARFTRSNPCPVCRGGDDMPRGQGVRCHGFLSEDGKYAHCSRVPCGEQEDGGTWAHRLNVECRCGTIHGEQQGSAEHGAGGNSARVIAATYDYRDEQGELLYQVVRYAPKSFSQRRPDGKGGWIWHLACDDKPPCTKNGSPPHRPLTLVRRVLYRLPEVLANPRTPVLLPEGEKDCDRLNELGYVATCNPEGAGKWRQEYAESLRGRQIGVIRDADRDKTPPGEPGRQHARRVASSLQGIASSVAVIELPGAQDASDFFDKGGTTEQLDQLLSETVEWHESAFVAEVQTPTPQPAPEVRELVVASGNEGTDDAEPNDAPKWPELDPAALYGLAGEIVRTLDEHTESANVATLTQFLTFFGSAAGRAPHFEVEADEHHGNLFAVIVGKTSSGKGSSYGQVRRIFREADDLWSKNNIIGNLSSGEGMVHAVRDPIYKDMPDKDNPDSCTRICVDQGVSDKRLLVYEPEFSLPLTVSQRPGNILSSITRQAWETGELQNSNKNSSERATDAHISILGHITFSEILQHLDNIGAANGLANRFLWVCVKSSRSLPFGGGLTNADLSPIYSKVARALASARCVNTMHRDDEANELWAAKYEGLRNQPDDMVGAICGRARPQVLRLSLIYALLDGSKIIRADHLRAALALWGYCAASARYIFGDATGDPVADKILASLKAVRDVGLTGADIHAVFHRHKTGLEIEAAINRLLRDKKIRVEPIKSGGARYFAC